MPSAKNDGLASSIGLIDLMYTRILFDVIRNRRLAIGDILTMGRGHSTWYSYSCHQVKAWLDLRGKDCSVVGRMTWCLPLPPARRTKRWHVKKRANFSLNVFRTYTPVVKIQRLHIVKEHAL